MVQGINTQNYSVEQLKELKNAGVKGISDDDIKAAEKKEAEQAKESDDNAEVSYSIEDDAATENEAVKEVKTAEADGKSLCNILENLIDKSESKDAELSEISQNLSKYELQMSDVMKQTVAINSDTEDELESIESDVNQTNKTIEEKQNEIKQKETEIKKLQSEIDSNPDDEENSDKQNQINDLSGDIKNLEAEIKTLNKNVSAKSKAEEKVKIAANAKLQLMGKSLENVKGDLTTALNKATDANEYADVTIEKGLVATETKAKCFFDKADKASSNEKKRLVQNAFDALFRKSKMKSLGNKAIATGEHLGNSSVGVGKEVKQLSSQYNMTFAESSNIETLISKEYVDTSKMDKMQDVKSAKGLFGKLKAAINNQKIINEVADAVKKKAAGETKTET